MCKLTLFFKLNSSKAVSKLLTPNTVPLKQEYWQLSAGIPPPRPSHCSSDAAQEQTPATPNSNNIPLMLVEVIGVQRNPDSEHHITYTLATLCHSLCLHKSQSERIKSETQVRTPGQIRAVERLWLFIRELNLPTMKWAGVKIGNQKKLPMGRPIKLLRDGCTSIRNIFNISRLSWSVCLQVKYGRLLTYTYMVCWRICDNLWETGGQQSWRKKFDINSCNAVV